MYKNQIVLFYYLCINIIAFFLFYFDKKRSIKKKWRISESGLMKISFLGGGLGSLLAMSLLRHKTKKIKFKILIPFSLILHILIIYAIKCKF